MIAEVADTVVTPDGLALAARTSRPLQASGGVVLCHPHPLYGGDMDNPVVVRGAEVCADLGLATLRFNFRGVGESEGTHGNGVGERADAEAALAHLGATLAGPARLGLLGYSFGAGVAARVAAAGSGLAALCLIAPPLALPGYARPSELKTFTGPVLVVGGSRDQYCPPAALTALTVDLPAARVRVIEGADHFFLGKLFPLGEIVADWARAAFRP
jgi:hypothetical protein